MELELLDRNPGEFFEKYIRDLFDFKKYKSPSFSPDIFDQKNGIVGEVKACKIFSSSPHVVLYVKQIKKYKSLLDRINHQKYFSNDKIDYKKCELCYFIVFYNKLLSNLVLHTFIIDENNLSNLIKKYKPKNTKWNLDNKLKNRIQALEDANQNILDGDRNLLMKNIIKNNNKGTYIRPNFYDLVGICKDIEITINHPFFGYYIKNIIHSTKLLKFLKEFI